MIEIGHIATFDRAFARIRAPLFLARQSGAANRRTLTLHTAESRSARTLGVQAAAALKAEGIDVACKVVIHRPAKLTRARSLEALTSRLGDGAIVYDPTRFVSRSEA